MDKELKLKVLDPESKITKGQLTSRRILDAAEGLFVRQRIESTTLKQIARKAGLKEPSLYKHYRCKDDIYNAVINRSVKQILAALDTLMNDQLTVADIVDMPGRLMQLLGKYPGGSRLVYREISQNGDSTPESVKLFIKEIIKQHPIFMGEITAGKFYENKYKQSIFRAITMMNVCLGYYASAQLLDDMGIVSMDDDTTQKEQVRIVRMIWSTFLTNEL